MEEALIKRILPHSIEAEQSVIGSMILDRDAILVASDRRRARQAAISRGEAQTAIDPRIPEWGNPAGAMPCYRPPNA